VKKFLLWIPSVPYLLTFGAILCVFHVLQVIALRLGYKPHTMVVNLMMLFLNLNKWWLASPIKFNNYAGKRNHNKPTIVISNHQSMFDIPAIGWLLKQWHPKYISKKSLAYGIPSVSYNIRNGGSIYIERNKPAEAIEKIKNFCSYLNQHNRGGVIFPEGTRSKDGHVNEFKTKGLLQMLAAMPNAEVIPVTVDGFWRLTQYRLRPMGFFINLTCTAYAPIKRAGKTNQQIIEEAQQVIKNNVFDKVEK